MTEIDCNFISFKGYTCRIGEASIIKPNVEIVSFKGKHQQGKSNNDVICIWFGNSKVEYFPRNLQRIFPNLNEVIIHNCGLKEISRQDLIGLENLVELKLDNNQLKSLPDDLFSNMPNLKRVGLSNNKIEFASSKLIEPIAKDQLEYFDLNSNTSINERYNPVGDGGCKTVQELMAKIDEECKSLKPRTISIALQTDSRYGNSSDEILKVCNEFRRLGRFTDFVIAVGSKEFPVNKNILASQSSVFAEMFEVKTNGRFASKLEISEMSQQAVEAFLDYLYKRKRPDKSNAEEIFKLAAKYDVAELKAICEQILHDGLDESNAFEIFKLACGQKKSEKLKVAAFRKLQATFGVELGDDVMNDPESLQKIVEAKKLLDDLVKKTRTNRNDKL